MPTNSAPMVRARKACIFSMTISNTMMAMPMTVITNTSVSWPFHGEWMSSSASNTVLVALLKPEMMCHAFTLLGWPDYFVSARLNSRARSVIPAQSPVSTAAGGTTLVPQQTARAPAAR